MENRIVFYLPKEALFEATVYYCDLIRRALGEIDGVNEVLYVNSIEEIFKEDTVVTIRIDDPFLLFNKCKRIIHWFQGIAPEERIMIGNGSLFSRLAALKYDLMEFILLRKSYFFFFVSESMKKHYEVKYKINLADQYAIMPCYNIQLDEASFMNNDKYKTPTFVYAGGIHNWQCVEESLQIYKRFKERCLNATFTILTKDKAKAEALIQRVGAKDVSVKFVPLQSLQEELSKYKYGFLLRKKHVVNRVSTPTKMNSYLGAGVIPIYTTMIADFDDNIDLGAFEIKFDTLDISFITTKLLEFENKIIDSNSVFLTFQKIFQCYYNDLRHKEQIRGKLINYLIEK